MAYWRTWDAFPVSKPRAAKGGIKAQSQRGGFGTTWWAKRWVAVLESFNLGGRLTRGRSYARSGQVVSLEIGKGAVKAAVQGSRPSPYRVSIGVKALPATGWQKVCEVVSSQAVFEAKLLAGEMPREVEGLFRDAGVSLFPERTSDLTTSCSCPDWSNPCKHVAAVYYLIGEEFDRDPFLIFQLRGCARDEFMRMLGGESKHRAPAEQAAPPEPLPAAPDAFWKMGAIPANLAGGEEAPPAGAGMTASLGKFPFWRGSLDLGVFLEQTRRAAAASNYPGST